MHAPDTALIQGADIDIQSSADGSDILDVLRLIRHDRASPARKDHVRHIIDSHIIGDIVYQRRFFPHSIKIFSKHLFFLLLLPGIPGNCETLRKTDLYEEQPFANACTTFKGSACGTSGTLRRSRLCPQKKRTPQAGKSAIKALSSLRWHYPNQVRSKQYQFPLSPLLQAPL